MAEHPNAEVVRRFVEAVNGGERRTAAALLSDNIEWHEIGRAEPIRGKAALVEHMTGPDAPDYGLHVEIHDVAVSDDHVVALINSTATRKGRTLHYRVAEIYHLADGRITARWPFSDDTAAIIAFFA